MFSENILKSFNNLEGVEKILNYTKFYGYYKLLINENIDLNMLNKNKVYCLILCTKGKLKIENIKGIVNLAFQSLAIFKTSDLISLISSEDNTEVNIFVLGGADLEILYNFNHGIYFRNVLTAKQYNKRILRELMCYAKSNDIDMLRAIEISKKIYNLLLDFVIFNNNCDILVQKFVQYVDNNINDKLYLNIIAKKLYVSVSKLSKIVKKELMISPYAFILEKKLNESENDLIKGYQSISEIAEKYKFDSCSAYVTAYKKKKGITPAQFRNSNLNTINQ